MSLFACFVRNISGFSLKSSRRTLDFRVGTGAVLSEEELAAMSPTAAAVAKIVKPGMKLTEVRVVSDLVVFH